MNLNNGLPKSKLSRMNINAAKQYTNLEGATFHGLSFEDAKSVFVYDTWFNNQTTNSRYLKITKTGNDYTAKKENSKLNDTFEVVDILSKKAEIVEPGFKEKLTLANLENDRELFVCFMFSIWGNHAPLRYIIANKAKISEMQRMGLLSDQNKKYIAHLAWLSGQGSIAGALYDPLTKQIATALFSQDAVNNNVKDTKLKAAITRANLTVSIDDITNRTPYYQEFIRICTSEPSNTPIGNGLANDISRFNYYWNFITSRAQAMNQSGGAVESGFRYFLNTISSSRRRHSRKAGSSRRRSMSRKAGRR